MKKNATIKTKKERLSNQRKRRKENNQYIGRSEKISSSKKKRKKINNYERNMLSIITKIVL